MSKNIQTTIKLCSLLILLIVKLCSKSFNQGFNSVWTEKFQMYKLDLAKAEEPEIKLPTYIGSWIKQRTSRKTSILFHWLCQSFWLCGSQQTVENSYRDGNKVKVKSLSRVRLFVTLWIVAYQAPPPMGFSRQEYWSGLPFPSPGDLPNPGIEPGSPSFQADTLTSEPRAGNTKP